MNKQTFRTELDRLGARINDLRVQRNITQQELAERLGTARSHVSGIETAQVDREGNPIKVPSLRLLHEIAQVFGVTMQELFREEAE